MEADALLGESPQSVVEGLHAERGPLAAILHTEVGTGDVVGEEAGVINLEDEARVDDGLDPSLV
jgi:hypothetical protein